MSNADTVAFEYAKENGTLGLDYNQIYDAVKHIRSVKSGE